MKKKISIFTLCCVGISALLLILALFNAIKLQGFVLNLLWTTLTLTVSGLLTLNSYVMLEKKNKLAIGSISLIVLSSLLVLLCFWTNLDDINFYLKATFVVSSLSVCFNLISSNVLKIGSNYKVIQIISYICFVLTTLCVILLFLDVPVDIKLFIVSIIFSFVALCVLAVFSKKNEGDIPDKQTQFLMISKEEYEELVACKKELEELRGRKND